MRTHLGHISTQLMRQARASVAAHARPGSRTAESVGAPPEGPGPQPLAMIQIASFLMEARDPERVAHRAAACLGLLPTVAWAEVDGKATAEPDVLTVDLEAANDPEGPTVPRRISLRLVDPDDDDARRTIEALLGLVTQVYRQQREARQLADAAYTDALTGLWNRRGFVQFVDQALARVARTGEEVALMMCDLDHFKQINDAHGHDAGDRALQAVAAAIGSVVRPSDLAARLGGDEIAILLSGSSAVGATRVAQRLRVALEAANPLAPTALTLSIGIADAHAVPRGRAGADAREVLLRAADEALYAAKNRGRDCAVVHSDCIDGVVVDYIDNEPTEPIAVG